MRPDYIAEVSDAFRSAIARRDSETATRVIQSVAAAGHRELANHMTRELIAAGLHPLARQTR